MIINTSIPNLKFRPFPGPVKITQDEKNLSCNLILKNILLVFN